MKSGPVVASDRFPIHSAESALRNSDSRLQVLVPPMTEGDEWIVDKEADRRRDEGLLRMLKMPPKRNKDMKLGKPRNPQDKRPKTKKPGQ
jgi:hypothetical protein